jgi:hypothetical protein
MFHVPITRPGCTAPPKYKMAFVFEQKTWPIAYIQQEVPGGASYNLRALPLPAGSSGQDL